MTTVRKSKVRAVRVAVNVFCDGREVCDLKCAAGKREYLYRIAEMMVRQGMVCPLCGGWLSCSDATFEHQAGRGHGGGHRDDRIEVDGKPQNAAVHGSCNSKKGSRRYHWVNGNFIPAVYLSAEDWKRAEA